MTLFQKAASYLDEFCQGSAIQEDLFALPNNPHNQALMQVIDEINRSGKGRVIPAGQGIKQDWVMQRQFLSPAYTTRWEDLPKVR